jgi:hypothetical protein
LNVVECAVWSVRFLLFLSGMNISRQGNSSDSHL